MTNKAAFMTKIRDMVIRDIPMPDIADDQILVRVDHVGICGSDVHYYENGRIGDFVVKGDYILGHECGGTVMKTGKSVENLKEGDKVALEPGIPCGECYFCRHGEYNLCPDVVFLATPPYHGCFSNYIAYPANMAFRLPEGVSTVAGALVEPLSVGLHACNQGGVTLGSSVVILGAGCIGLMTLLAAKAYGATDITVVDVLDIRLEKALELGATRVINGKDKDAAAEIDALTGGWGADVVIETAGSSFTVRQSAYIVRRGGTIVLVGMVPEDSFEFCFSKIMAKEATIKTVFRYRNLYPVAIEAIRKGLIDPEPVASHFFPFSDIKNAFETNIVSKSEVVKIVIDMSK